MAIEKVGGARAYVIKGNTNPQARAQYWANLVTQEKYKLWETAQQEALSQMKQEELEYRTEADIYQTQLRELTDYRTRMNREVQKLEQQLIKGAPKTSTTSGTRTVREGGGRSGQSNINLQNREINDVRKVEQDLLDIQAQLDLYGNKPQLTSALNKSKEAQKSYLETKLDSVDNSSMTPRQKESVKNYIRKVNEDYGLGIDAGPVVPLPAAGEGDVAAPAPSTTRSVPYTTTRTTSGLSPEDRASIEKRIAELQAEIATTQAQEQELVKPTLDRTGLLERTRGVLAEDLQPRQRVPRSMSMSPARRAELEAIGVDQEFIDETTGGYDATLPEETPAYVEPQPRPMDTRQMEIEALGMEPEEFYQTPPATRQEVREARKEMEKPADALSDIKLEDLPERERPQGAVVIRPEITYKRDVIKKAADEGVLKVMEAEDKPEWAAIVERLYTPTKNQTPQDRAELLKNAWDEITLAYSDDRETMKKAHTLLVAIDKSYNSKQTPK